MERLIDLPGCVNFRDLGGYPAAGGRRVRWGVVFRSDSLAALTESDRGLWGVYVVNDQSRVERRLVEIIHTESERAYVRGTLENDDRIVRTGVQRIVPGQQVTADIAPLQDTAALSL